ncbi:DUF2163 domain-containing protein [Tropicimonas marinistellae]|uniref:DUF2163 domain-containing protein n=1 Tax=Tropicimonas marinistellae TaxID=1739787 RepID=UPI00082EA9A2|nr:DUF2163 domain-containing protein [Tropicimonas marinistellae]
MAKFSASGQALLSHLGEGSTTVCRCWRVVRKDGMTLGFTDHDVDVEFDGTLFAASSGFTASALEQTTGLAVDNSEAAGALSAAAISEEDIEAGKYDGADVTSWLVNWHDPTQRLVQFKGSLGEITRSGDAFRSELRGLTEDLNQPQGHVYQSVCSAVLGDSRCQFDLDSSGFAQETEVLAVVERIVVQVPDDGIRAEGWYNRGRIVVADGMAAGTVALIKRDQIDGATRNLELWQELRSKLSAGDTIRLEPGCDKRADTCAKKFDNILNFRGFPDIPGADWLTAYPTKADDNDGGSRNG